MELPGLSRVRSGSRDKADAGDEAALCPGVTLGGHWVLFRKEVCVTTVSFITNCISASYYVDLAVTDLDHKERRWQRKCQRRRWQRRKCLTVKREGRGGTRFSHVVLFGDSTISAHKWLEYACDTCMTPGAGPRAKLHLK